MSSAVAGKFRSKLDPPALYLRLLWNVLILRRELVIVDFQGSLGDMVSFCASLPGLRARHGRCWIAFVVIPAYGDLVRSTGLVDAAAQAYGFFHFFARRLCRPENYYIPTALSSNPLEARNINPPIHTARHFAELLGVTPDLNAVRLLPAANLQRSMRQRLAEINPENLPVVVAHTGPTWTVKEWPAAFWEKWSCLMLQNLRVRLIQTGTEVSASPLHNHASVRLHGAVDWVNRLDVMESVSLIGQAQLFVGIDSGPLHLATTLGTPSIGLFGPVVGAYRVHPRARFICIAADVPCLGCHHDPAGELHWRTGCPYDIRCMKGITPQSVFQAASIMLGGAPAREQPEESAALET